jgi:hypothetical protein
MLDGEVDEEQTHQDHDQVSVVKVVESGKVPEIQQLGEQEIVKQYHVVFSFQFSVFSLQFSVVCRCCRQLRTGN